MVRGDNVIDFPGPERKRGPKRRLNGPAQPPTDLADVRGLAPGLGWPWDEQLVQPELFARRDQRAGYVVRLELDDTHPPIWRRLLLASDLSLPDLHDVVQVAMGWSDSHLHRFTMGPWQKDPQMASFLTAGDVEEGECDGPLEADSRLDEVLAEPGQRLFYDYDFGDGWKHTLRLEKVLPWQDDDPPAQCLAGRRACPPDDVGGLPGFEEVLEALAGRVAPGQEEWMRQKLQWLPPGYDPAYFSVEKTNALLTSSPTSFEESWRPDVYDVLNRLPRDYQLRMEALLAAAAIRLGSASRQPSDAEIMAEVNRYQTLLEVVGDGLTLTGAGYLPPKVVKYLYDTFDMSAEWIGMGNREDQTWPIASLRRSATQMGLLRKAKNRLAVTRLGARLAGSSPELLAHIYGHLPAGTGSQVDAGMLAMVHVAGGLSWSDAMDQAVPFMEALGWMSADGLMVRAMWAESEPTRTIVGHLAGGRERVSDVATRVLSRAFPKPPGS